MIPRDPTPEMIAAAKAAVSGFPRDSAIEAIWQAMWDAAIVDGTATAAANGDLPVPQDCQARAEGIAQKGSHD